MKIIAVCRNYAAHAAELNNPIASEPVFFLKPDTAVLKDNKPFYIPEFSNKIHYELEIVLKICKEGKHIAEKFAANYFEEIGLGIDFTARDVQSELKQKSLPWEMAKAFDNSAAIGSFVPKSQFENISDLHFELFKNSEKQQAGYTSRMLFSFEKIISYVSKYVTLKKGDLIFTGTPEGVGRVAIGDQLEGKLMDQTLLKFDIK